MAHRSWRYRAILLVPVLLILACVLATVVSPLGSRSGEPDPLVRIVHEAVRSCGSLPLGPLGEIDIGSVRDVSIVSREQTPDGVRVAFEGVCAFPFAEGDPIRGNMLVGGDGQVRTAEWGLANP